MGIFDSNFTKSVRRSIHNTINSCIHVDDLNVEVKDGKVFVNGQQVYTTAAKESVDKQKPKVEKKDIKADKVFKGDFLGDITVTGKDVKIIIEGDFIGNIMGAADVIIEGDCVGNVSKI